MKANELMVGDLVFVHKPTCKGHRVDYINEMDEEIGADGEIYNVCDVEPIPLTPEILEKNGFYYDEDRKAYLMGVIFRVKPERYGLFSFEICGCPYSLNTVHQLQQALRLCGIEKEIAL